MKVVVVVPYYFPAIGGVENYSRAVVKELQTQGHTVTVITTRLPGAPSREVIDGASIIRLRPWFKVSNTPLHPFWYFQIRKILRREKPDVMHVHSPVPYLGDMAVLAAKRTPVLLTYHSGSMRKGHGKSDAIISFYERHILPRVFKRVKKVGAVLPSFVTSLISPSDREKVLFVPPGVDANVYKPGGEKSVDAIFVGRVERTSSWKGVDIFLRAVAVLKRKKPDISVQVIGSGDAVEGYQILANDLGIKDNVAFVTGLYSEQIIPFYQAARMLVLPSKTESESFGMVLIEAMACGVPVIGSRIGGIPNVIEHDVSGLLVPPSDADSLAAAMDSLLEDTEYRERLGKNALKRVKGNFSLQKMTGKNVALLSEMAKREIVHVTAYYPPHLGGMEQAIAMLVAQLDQHAYQQRVVTSNIGAENGDRDGTSRLSIHRLSAFMFASTPIMPKLLKTLLSCSSNSIFHVHIAQAGIPEVAFLAAKIKKVPIVMHLHGDVEASTAAGRLLPIYKKIFLGFVLRHADTVIVPTKTYKTMMTQKYRLTNDVQVVPAGISDRFFVRKQTDKQGDRLKLLYVGRLSVEKNVPMLIEAMTHVEHPVDFVIVGDGPLRSAIEQVATKVKTKHTVKLVGRKSPQEVLDYYKKSDLFVLASDYESQSLAALEAMATGTPVIVPNVPAVNEVVRGAGVVTEKSIEGFAEAITHLIENKHHRQELAKKGVERARQYDWARVIRKFEGIYEKYGL